MAFGIQAWWEQLGEAQRREAILSGLESDFRAASVNLDSVIAGNEQFLAGAARLMEITQSGAVDPTLGPQVDSLLSLILWGGSFVAPPGTLQALIATGSLDLLNNEALAQALTPWPAWLADLQEEERQNSERISRLLTLLAESGVDGSNLAWHEVYPEVPWTLEYTDAWAVVGTPVIRNMISEIWFGYRSKGQRQQRLRQGLDEILRLLVSAA